MTYTEDLQAKINAYTEKREKANYADTRAKYAGLVMGLEYALKRYINGEAKAPKVMDLHPADAHPVNPAPTQQAKA